MDFVGRREEIEELQRCFESNRNELVALYGRRRVGKTALVDHLFDGRYFFRHVGFSPEKRNKNGAKRQSPLKDQLASFSISLRLAGWEMKKAPHSWLEAFCELILFLKSAKKEQRKVIFIDEIPWMDTPKSAFLESFAWFINSILTSSEYNVMIIIAGSSTSWMLDNVVNDYGGLYGRCTLKMRLLPFSLRETELALRAWGVDLPRYHIALAYMSLGGIPYYLKQVKPGLSLPASIDAMFFKPNAEFKEEFATLFSSMFDNKRLCEGIVRFLSTSRRGYSRKQILEGVGATDGQTFSNALLALEKGSFLVRYVPYKGKENDPLYKLIDPFCLFFLANVEKEASLDESVWSDTMASQRGNAWKGYAFENLVFSHLGEIKRALGIVGVQSMQFSYSDEANSTQIDLLIERKDKIIDLCEMKFYSTPFPVNEAYHELLASREAKLRSVAPKDMAIRHVLITTFGATGLYRHDFSNIILLDDLFL